ncbi:rhsA domain protein [Escherichia coli p0305293.12]|nr:rhsA domain protein [Escherichia coli p0305293.12]
MHQPVLTVVMVPVGALIIRTDTPFRDEVGFLCQPAVRSYR